MEKVFGVPEVEIMKQKQYRLLAKNFPKLMEDSMPNFYRIFFSLSRKNKQVQQQWKGGRKERRRKKNKVGHKLREMD